MPFYYQHTSLSCVLIKGRFSPALVKQTSKASLRAEELTFPPRTHALVYGKKDSHIITLNKGEKLCHSKIKSHLLVAFLKMLTFTVKGDRATLNGNHRCSKILQE